MTQDPIEKAKELVEKYIHYRNKYGTTSIDMDDAKNLALITIDEILNMQVLYYPHNALEKIFWQSVKNEINNL